MNVLEQVIMRFFIATGVNETEHNMELNFGS